MTKKSKILSENILGNISKKQFTQFFNTENIVQPKIAMKLTA